MFIAQSIYQCFKLRRSGMCMSPLTGLGVDWYAGAINMKSLRDFTNRLRAVRESNT